MAKMNKKKFNIKGVFDGIRFSVGAQQRLESEIEETLRTDHFQVCNVSPSSSYFASFVRLSVAFFIFTVSKF